MSIFVSSPSTSSTLIAWTLRSCLFMISISASASLGEITAFVSSCQRMNLLQYQWRTWRNLVRCQLNDCVEEMVHLVRLQERFKRNWESFGDLTTFLLALCRSLQQCNNANPTSQLISLFMKYGTNTYLLASLHSVDQFIDSLKSYIYLCSYQLISFLIYGQLANCRIFGLLASSIVIHAQISCRRSGEREGRSFGGWRTWERSCQSDVQRYRGVQPCSSQYSMMPNDQTSVFKLQMLLNRPQGLMYKGLPMFRSLNLIVDLIANPKSAILGTFFLVRNIFDSLTSLCMIEFLESSSKPLQIPYTRDLIQYSLNLPLILSSRCRSESQSYVMMQQLLTLVNTSQHFSKLRWLHMLFKISISFYSNFSYTLDLIEAIFMTFIATCFPVLTSQPLQAAPKFPFPSRSSQLKIQFSIFLAVESSCAFSCELSPIQNISCSIRILYFITKLQTHSLLYTRTC